jgi:hypothetical protein
MSRNEIGNDRKDKEGHLPHPKASRAIEKPGSLLHICAAQGPFASLRVTRQEQNQNKSNGKFNYPIQAKGWLEWGTRLQLQLGNLETLKPAF